MERIIAGARAIVPATIAYIPAMVLEALVLAKWLEWCMLCGSAVSMTIAVCALGRFPWVSVAAAAENVVFALSLCQISGYTRTMEVTMAFMVYLVICVLFSGLCLAFTAMPLNEPVIVLYDTTLELPPDDTLVPAYVPNSLKAATALVRFPRPRAGVMAAFASRCAHRGAHRVHV